MACDIAEAREGGVPFCDAFERQRLIVVVFHLLQHLLDTSVLVLQCMCELMGKYHCAHAWTQPADIQRATAILSLNYNHLLSIRVVETNDLISQEFERLVLQVNPGRIQPGHRSALASNPQIFVAMVAGDLGAHGLLSLI